jgi:GT2 family glycosyltransferase
MTRPVHVVIVAFGRPAQLDRCLSSIGSTLERTVVDNSSSLEVRGVVEDHTARYLDAARNRGFAGGVNVALRRLFADEPRDVLLLNPDASVQAADMARLTQYLHESSNARVAAVAPRLVNEDGIDQRVVWPFPSPVRAWREALGLPMPPPGDEIFVIGAALLLRWEALHEVGLFDERFFLYAEETDWQRRARDLGWTSSLCRDVVGAHTGGGASVDEARREALFHAAQETYIRKWFGAKGWWSYRVAAVAGATGRALVLSGDRRAAAGRRALTYARGPRRRAGFPSAV